MFSDVFDMLDSLLLLLPLCLRFGSPITSFKRWTSSVSFSDRAAKQGKSNVTSLGELRYGQGSRNVVAKSSRERLKLHRVGFGCKLAAKSYFSKEKLKAFHT